MSASVSRQGDTLLLKGQVGFDNAAGLAAAGLRLLQNPTWATVVDLGGLKGETSITVAVVVQWLRAATAAGQRLSLANVPEQFRAIAGVSGLGEVIPAESVPQ